MSSILILSVFNFALFYSQESDYMPPEFVKVSQTYKPSQKYLYDLFNNWVRKFDPNIRIHYPLRSHKDYFKNYTIYNISFSGDVEGYFKIGGSIIITRPYKSYLYSIPEDPIDILFGYFLDYANLFGLPFFFYNDSDDFFGPIIFLGYEIHKYSPDLEFIAKSVNSSSLFWWNSTILNWRARLKRGEFENILNETTIIYIEASNEEFLKNLTKVFGVPENFTLSDEAKQLLFFGSRYLIEKYINATEWAIEYKINSSTLYTIKFYLRLVYPELKWPEETSLPIYLNSRYLLPVASLIDWDLFYSEPFNESYIRLRILDCLFWFKFIEYYIALLEQYLAFGYVADLYSPFYFNKKDLYVYVRMEGKVKTYIIDGNKNIYYPGTEVPEGYYRVLSPYEIITIPKVDNYTYAVFNLENGILKTDGKAGGIKLDSNVYFEGYIFVYEGEKYSYILLKDSEVSYKVTVETTKGISQVILIPNKTIQVEGKVKEIRIGEYIIYKK